MYFSCCCSLCRTIFTRRGLQDTKGTKQLPTTQPLGRESRDKTADLKICFHPHLLVDLTTVEYVDKRFLAVSAKGQHRVPDVNAPPLLARSIKDRSYLLSCWHVC